MLLDVTTWIQINTNTKPHTVHVLALYDWRLFRHLSVSQLAFSMKSEQCHAV